MYENSEVRRKFSPVSSAYLLPKMDFSTNKDVGTRISKLYMYDWTINNYDMIKPQPDAAVSPDFMIGLNSEGKLNIHLTPCSDNNLKIEILLERTNAADVRRPNINATFLNAVLNLEFVDSNKKVIDYCIALPCSCKYINKRKHYSWKKDENVSRFIFNNSLTLCAKVSLSYPSLNLEHDQPCCKSIEILSNDMKRLIGNSSFADVLVSVGGQRFLAHKAIILPQLFRSEILNSKLNSEKSIITLEKFNNKAANILDKDYEVIYIENENSDVFLSILHYFYSGKFHTSDVNNFSLYEFAKKYQLTELCRYLTPDKMSSCSVIKTSKVIFYWHVEYCSIRSFDKFTLLHSPGYKLLLDNKEVTWNVSLFFFDLKNIFLSLQRGLGCEKDLQTVFKLAVCGLDGTPYQEQEYRHLFKHKTDFSYPGFLDPESRFTIEPALLYDDTLSIRCELSVSDGELTSDTIPTHAGEFSKLNFKYWTTNLKDLLCNKKFSDVTLEVDEKEFKVHKSILSARSPVFARMLECDMVEKLSGRIIINDISSAVMECAINFIYTGKLENLLMCNACQLYRAADKYEISDLRDRCSEFILANLDVNSACEVFILADLYNDIKIKSAAKNLICRRANHALMTTYGLELMTNHPHLANDILENLSAVFCSLPPQDLYLNFNTK